MTNTKSNLILYAINLALFDQYTQVTTQQSLSDEMKVFYSDYLIDNAKPNLVHDQFGQKHPIPKGRGKTIEFRKYSPLAKALTPLVEGTTPAGNSLTVSTITASVSQYGDYIELSDILLLTAIDNNLVHATKLLGNQAGETLDTITREVINGGENVQYADQRSGLLARYQLKGGESTEANNCYLSVDCIRRAVRTLKNNKAKKINGSYVAIIHPDIAYDIMGDDDWEKASLYAGSTQIFEGEIGRIHGVRFVETTEAKIFHAPNLTAAARNLTIKTALATAGKTVTVKEAISAAEATALVGRDIIIGATLHEIASAEAGTAGNATITTKANVSTEDGAKDTVIYPGEAGAKGRDVYSTLVLGSDAYGVTEVTGGGLKNIVKQLGSAGTGDPLDQRATTGWKAIKTAEILVENYMVRIETASTFESGAN